MAGPGCMTTNGVLKDGKLTPEFKAATIARLKKMSKEGSKAGNPLLSGCKFADAIPPSDIIPDDIEDEEKYPDFHKEVWKLYEDALKSFDVEGNFSLPPPIMDPTALVNKLGGDASKVSFDIKGLPSLNPAELGLILGEGGLTELAVPVKFAADIPKLVAPPPPVAMPDTLGLNLPTPSLDLTINLPPGSGFSEKFEVDSWPLAVFKAFPDIVTGLLDPGNLFKLATEVPASPCFAIEPLVEGNAFGPSDDGDKMKKIVQQDLASVTGKAATVAAVAQVIGDGGRPGLTGKLCTDFELVAEPPPPGPPPGLTRVRKAWLAALEKVMGPFNEGLIDGSGDMMGSLGPYSGYQPINQPGVGGETLDPGYKAGPAATGPGGGKVTSCGLLPAKVMDIFIKDASREGTFVFATQDAKKDGPNGGKVADPALKFACGPQGTFACGKMLRAYVPAESGELPKEGDIYFVGTGGPRSSDVRHVGIIYRVRDDGDTVRLATADAGQGPADNQALAWVGKYYNKTTLTLIGSNGAGADGNKVDQTGAHGGVAGGGSSPANGARGIKGWIDIDKALGAAFYGEDPSSPMKPNYVEAWKLQFSAPQTASFWASHTVLAENKEKKASKSDKIVDWQDPEATSNA